MSGEPPPPDPAPAEGDTAVALAGGRVLVAGDRLPTIGEAGAATALRRLALGRHDDVPVWALELGPGAAPEGLAAVGLRDLHDVVGERLWALAGRGVQLLAWDRDHRFCGRCATPTARVAGEHARRCPVCGLAAYPRLSPAVIVLVERGDEILLARSTRPGAAFHSTLAGFVEPGETLEQAVRREVMEEVAVELAEVRYFGSQPWPFPNSLMIGFRAAWASGEPRPDLTEIAEAGWFRADALPPVPPRLSIARSLIEDFRRRQGRAAPRDPRIA